MATKQYSYQDHPIIKKVFLADQDVSSSVQSINNIQSALDYPNLAEFRIAEARIVLRDPNNDFNTQNPQNFYVRNGTMSTPVISASGYRMPVRIELGFMVDNDEHVDTVYTGMILNVSKNAKNGNVTILCSDESQKIRFEQITDFGIQKHMRVVQSGGSLEGNYPFFEGLTEPSSESISGTDSDASSPTPLMRKDVLRTEGALQSTNFQELPTGIATEGGPIDTHGSMTDAILNFKSPYRFRSIKSFVEKLLEKYGIANDIQLPLGRNSENYFSNLGRPGYETHLGDLTAAINTLNAWQWPGVVTDTLVDEPNDTLYLLISQTGSMITSPETPIQKPMILKWNVVTDEKEILVDNIGDGSSAVLEEAWKFVANSDFSTFYVLGTRPIYIRAVRTQSTSIVARPGWQFGSYDSSEETATLRPRTRIHRITNAQTSPVRTTYINSDSIPGSLYPQMACYYHLGFGRTESESQNRLPNRYGSLPDSRRNLHLATNGSLYYAFANRNAFGVARAAGPNNATRILSVPTDEDGFNGAGFDFVIDEGNDYAFLAHTFISSNSSRFKIIRGDI